MQANNVRDIDSIKVKKEMKISKKDRELINKIKKSISIVGFIFYPILIDTFGNLIDGHIRLICSKELGYKTIKVIVVDTTDNEVMNEYIKLSSNLDRKHFTYLEHGEMLIEGKVIYEKLFPESKNTHIPEVESFSKNVSNTSKKSQKVVQENLKVYTKLREINNKYILPLLHSLENNFNFKHTKTELESIPKMDSKRLDKFVSILRDIDTKSIKRTPNMRLKEILINLDSYSGKQTISTNEMISFNIYKYCSDKPEYKDLLDSMDIDLVKYNETNIKVNKDFLNLVKFLEK